MAEHQVPFVHPVTGERRLTRIFHDIKVVDYKNEGGDGSNGGAAQMYSVYGGVDDSGVEGCVRLPFNHRAILSLIEHGYIHHIHSIYDGEVYRVEL